MWEFVLNHPCWGFFYLSAICLTVICCVAVLSHVCSSGRSNEPEKKLPKDKETL